MSFIHSFHLISENLFCAKGSARGGDREMNGEAPAFSPVVLSSLRFLCLNLAICLPHVPYWNLLKERRGGQRDGLSVEKTEIWARAAADGKRQDRGRGSSGKWPPSVLFITQDPVHRDFLGMGEEG